jgi:hypothetical protein
MKTLLLCHLAMDTKDQRSGWHGRSFLVGIGRSPESFQRLRIMRHFVRQKFQGHESAQADVFGLVHNAHATAAEFFHYAVVRNVLADEGNGVCHWTHILVFAERQVNKTQMLAS